MWGGKRIKEVSHEKIKNEIASWNAGMTPIAYIRKVICDEYKPWTVFHEVSQRQRRLNDTQCSDLLLWCADYMRLEYLSSQYQYYDSSIRIAETMKIVNDMMEVMTNPSITSMSTSHDWGPNTFNAFYHCCEVSRDLTSAYKWFNWRAKLNHERNLLTSKVDHKIGITSDPYSIASFAWLIRIAARSQVTLTENILEAVLTSYEVRHELQNSIIFHQDLYFELLPNMLINLPQSPMIPVINSILTAFSEKHRNVFSPIAFSPYNEVSSCFKSLNNAPNANINSQGINTYGIYAQERFDEQLGGDQVNSFLYRHIHRKQMLYQPYNQLYPTPFIMGSYLRPSIQLNLLLGTNTFSEIHSSFLIPVYHPLNAETELYGLKQYDSKSNKSSSESMHSLSQGYPTKDVHAPKDTLQLVEQCVNSSNKVLTRATKCPNHMLHQLYSNVYQDSAEAIYSCLNLHATIHTPNKGSTTCELYHYIITSLCKHNQVDKAWAIVRSLKTSNTLLLAPTIAYLIVSLNAEYKATESSDDCIRMAKLIESQADLWLCYKEQQEELNKLGLPHYTDEDGEGSYHSAWWRFHYNTSLLLQNNWSEEQFLLYLIEHIGLKHLCAILFKTALYTDELDMNVNVNYIQSTEMLALPVVLPSLVLAIKGYSDYHLTLYFCLSTMHHFQCTPNSLDALSSGIRDWSFRLHKDILTCLPKFDVVCMSQLYGFSDYFLSTRHIWNDTLQVSDYFRKMANSIASKDYIPCDKEGHRKLKVYLIDTSFIEHHSNWIDMCLSPNDTTRAADTVPLVLIPYFCLNELSESAMQGPPSDAAIGPEQAHHREVSRDRLRGLFGHLMQQTTAQVSVLHFTECLIPLGNPLRQVGTGAKGLGRGNGWLLQVLQWLSWAVPPGAAVALCTEDAALAAAVPGLPLACRVATVATRGPAQPPAQPPTGGSGYGWAPRLAPSLAVLEGLEGGWAGGWGPATGAPAFDWL